MADFETENDKYLEDSKNIQIQLEELIEKAEEIIAGAGQEPVLSQVRQTTDTAGETAVGSDHTLI